MKQISRHFRPVTAQSDVYRTLYVEIAPCPALAPYVACFWAPRDGVDVSKSRPLLVVPDACMDIMFRQTETGLHAQYSGLDDGPFISTGQAPLLLGVRFHFWAVHLFTGADLQGGMPGAMEAYFDGWQPHMEEIFLRHQGLMERVHAIEAFLLARLNPDLQSPSMLNAIHALVRSHGALPIRALCADATMSQRQLERHFVRHVGVSMKKMAGIVRYQNVWQDALLHPGFDVQNAIHRYGYVDQAHLLNTFKRYHGITLRQALVLARQGVRDVENIQDENPG